MLPHGEDKRNCLMDNNLEKDWNKETDKPKLKNIYKP